MDRPYARARNVRRWFLETPTPDIERSPRHACVESGTCGTCVPQAAPRAHTSRSARNWCNARDIRVAIRHARNHDPNLHDRTRAHTRKKTRGCRARCRTPRGMVFDVVAAPLDPSCTAARAVFSSGRVGVRHGTRQPMSFAQLVMSTTNGAYLAPVASASSESRCGPSAAPARPAMPRAQRLDCRHVAMIAAVRAVTAPTNVLLGNGPTVIWETGRDAATRNPPLRWTRDA